MVDPAPAHVGDVEQAVDAAEVDEGAVLGDVLDDALDDLALLEGLERLGLLLVALLLEEHAAREHDVAALLVELDDLELVGLPDELVQVADGPEIDLRAGEERLHAAADGDRQAALHALADGPFDELVALARGRDLVPHLHLVRFLLGKRDEAVVVLAALDVDVDRCRPALTVVWPWASANSDRAMMPSLLPPMSMIDVVALDGDDRALDDLAFLAEVAGADAGFEHDGEAVGAACGLLRCFACGAQGSGWWSTCGWESPRRSAASREQRRLLWGYEVRVTRVASVLGRAGMHGRTNPCSPGGDVHVARWDPSVKGDAASGQSVRLPAARRSGALRGRRDVEVEGGRAGAKQGVDEHRGQGQRSRRPACPGGRPSPCQARRRRLRLLAGRWPRRPAARRPRRTRPRPRRRRRGSRSRLAARRPGGSERGRRDLQPVGRSRASAAEGCSARMRVDERRAVDADRSRGPSGSSVERGPADGVGERLARAGAGLARGDDPRASRAARRARRRAGWPVLVALPDELAHRARRPGGPEGWPSESTSLPGVDARRARRARRRRARPGPRRRRRLGGRTPTTTSSASSMASSARVADDDPAPARGPPRWHGAAAGRRPGPARSGRRAQSTTSSSGMVSKTSCQLGLDVGPGRRGEAVRRRSPRARAAITGRWHRRAVDAERGRALTPGSTRGPGRPSAPRSRRPSGRSCRRARVAGLPERGDGARRCPARRAGARRPASPRSVTDAPLAASSSKRRRARTSGRAVRKNFTSASGKTTVPMSRPSSTTPPLSARLPLQVEERVADALWRRHGARAHPDVRRADGVGDVLAVEAHAQRPARRRARRPARRRATSDRASAPTAPAVVPRHAGPLRGERDGAVHRARVDEDEAEHVGEAPRDACSCRRPRGRRWRRSDACGGRHRGPLTGPPRRRRARRARAAWRRTSGSSWRCRPRRGPACGPRATSARTAAVIAMRWSPRLSTSAGLEGPVAALDVEPVGLLLARDAEGAQHAWPSSRCGRSPCGGAPRRRGCASCRARGRRGRRRSGSRRWRAAPSRRRWPWRAAARSTREAPRRARRCAPPAARPRGPRPCRARSRAAPCASG